MAIQAQGRVLAIAGSDSGGGAGVQADIKTVTALGGYAMTAITAITVQNTVGVRAVHAIPSELVRAQIEAVTSDLGADAWKTGMLGSVAHVRVVADAYEQWGAGVPLVVDPVMTAKGGAALLADDAASALADRLLRLATLITPNAPEAERLTGFAVANLDAQKRAAVRLVEMGAGAALVKGGHIEGQILNDVLATADGMDVFSAPRLDTRATHGTGCTLASAIAALLAQGVELPAAVGRARLYLTRAMLAAPGFGDGHQPLGHGWPVKREG